MTVVDSLASSVRVAVTSTWPFEPSGAPGSSRTTRVVELDCVGNIGPSVESARVTFQYEGKYVASKERSNERVFITLSLVTSTVTLTAVPGTRYS